MGVNKGERPSLYSDKQGGVKVHQSINNHNIFSSIRTPLIFNCHEVMVRPAIYPELLTQVNELEYVADFVIRDSQL